MAAPSSTPRDRHLVWDPRKQTAMAQSMEKPVSNVSNTKHPKDFDPMCQKDD